MRIQRVLLSCDDNPVYSGFWPLVAKLWKRLDVMPTLVHIADCSPPDYFSDGEVIVIPRLPDIPTYIQALWARYFYTQLFSDEVCIISDIDMLPLSREYFVESISRVSESSYVHLNLNPKGYSRIPTCYHVARGEVFKSHLELDDDWERSLRKVMQYPGGSHPNFETYHTWFIDEDYATAILKGKTIIGIPRAKQRRIDRSDFTWCDKKLKNGYYFDCHAPRPYARYCEELEYIAARVFAQT